MIAGVMVVALAGVSLPEATAQSTAPASPSGPAIEYQTDKRTLTVRLNGLPLQQVMEELSRQTHIRFRPPAQTQAFDNRPITASFERMPIERAIKQLLGPSNTAIIYGAKRTATGKDNHIVITEVRVFDLGIIPIVATAVASDGGNQSTRSQNPAKLAENQAIRDAKKQKRAEKKQGSSNKKGGRSGGDTTNNQNQSNVPNDQSSTGASSSKPTSKSGQSK